jgi:hypothetical protein
VEKELLLCLGNVQEFDRNSSLTELHDTQGQRRDIRDVGLVPAGDPSEVSDHLHA